VFWSDTVMGMLQRGWSRFLGFVSETSPMEKVVKRRIIKNVRQSW
jgi:hypothetical protein